MMINLDSAAAEPSSSGEPATQTTSWNFYQQLADQVLAGHQVTRAEALSILAAPDDDLLALLSAGFRIRQKYFGKTVQLYFLMSAKSGLCPEDCHYCSQSKISTAPVPKYNILKRDELLEAAKVASERGAKTYCLVISARGPNERELNAVEANRARNQAKIWPRYLRLPGLALTRTSRPFEGLWCRSRQPQPEHQRRTLRGHLHDAHLRRPHRNVTSRSRRGHGDVQRRDHRDGRKTGRHRVDGDGLARTWGCNRSP